MQGLYYRVAHERVLSKETPSSFIKGAVGYLLMFIFISLYF